jgi:hypothetical protein
LYDFEIKNDVIVEAIRILNANQEKSLEQTEKEFMEAVTSAALESVPPEYVRDVYSSTFGWKGDVIGELKRQQRYSLILTTLSFFEGRLQLVCELIETYFNFTIKLKDIKNPKDSKNPEIRKNPKNKKDKRLTDLGKEIPVVYAKKYWYYLEKVYQIKTDESNQEGKTLKLSFDKIEDQRIVRNRIAHQDGSIHSEDLEKLNLINGLSTKGRKGEEVIDIKGGEFTNYLLDEIEQFFRQLCRKVSERSGDIPRESRR